MSANKGGGNNKTDEEMGGGVKDEISTPVERYEFPNEVTQGNIRTCEARKVQGSEEVKLGEGEYVQQGLWRYLHRCEDGMEEGI